MTVIRVFIIVVLLAGVEKGWSQTGAVRRAMRALDKEQWQKSRSILDKALRKDSAVSSLYFGFSRYYFTPQNPAFDIDSAYSFINMALATSRTDIRDKRSKDTPDTLAFLDLRRKIDSAAFARATREHTELSYNFFIDHFSHAWQLDTARQLRDEVAWNDAVSADTPEAFAEYVEKYPASRYAGRALARHEELIFMISTQDQRLGSFESYLAEYPNSPFRHLVEEEILGIYTADGSADKFISFLRRYTQGRASRKARNILYHLKREAEPGMESFTFWTDSLKRAHQLGVSFLVPFIADKKFGFMDTAGREIIPATSATLYGAYRCGNILEDILVHGNDVISRDGTRLYSGELREMSELGYGFIGIQSGDCYRVLHKSGFTVGGSCVDDAAVVEGRFVAIQEGDFWSLYSLTGRSLTTGWEEVRPLGEVIALRRHGKWSLVTVRQLGMVADQHALEPTHVVDDVRAWPNGQVWVKRGNTEGVLDEDLLVRIPFGEYRLRREVFGILSRSPDCISVFTPELVPSACFEDVKFNSSWVCVKQNSRWRLHNPVSGATFGSYDSIAFTGIFAACHRGDSVRVFFNDTLYADFRNVSLAFIPGSNAKPFLQVEHAGRKTVYDASAAKLFEGFYDRIQHAGDGYFIVSRKEKKGLISSDGKQILPFNYDAIGETEGNRIALLRGMQFGLYDAATRKEIRPAYDKRIQAYDKELLVVTRRGKSGMIDFNNRIHVPFQYDAFQFWNDTSALARQGKVWRLIDLRANKVLIDDIHDYNIVAESDHETVIIIRRGGEYGVLSSTRGEVIPVSYTDLVNIGSAGDPLYFTEKHVKEASLSVVIYYDGNGRPIRHQALEPNDFDAIYCEEN